MPWPAGNLSQWATMATVGQPSDSAVRRITVHYANSPTRNTGEENFEDSIDDGQLQFVLGQVSIPDSASFPSASF
jgi:hypothetical protein